MSARFALVLASIVGLASGCGLLGLGREDLGLELVFHGNAELSQRTLREAVATVLEDFRTTAYKKSAVDDAAYEIERRYHSEGFPFATVDYVYEEPPGELPTASFAIVEGPRTELVEILFAGNRAFDAQTLVRFFEGPRGAWFRRSRTWYEENRVSNDAGEIERWYYAHGYLDARASEPVVTLDAERERATVVLRIDEGIEYRLAGVTVEGAGEADLAALAASYAGYLDRPYFERIALEIQGRIEEHYANGGHPDVHVERIGREASPAGEVRLVYRATPGPRVTIAAVEIEGAQETRRSFLLSRLELEPGDVYSRAKERESFRRLYQTGLFERVHVGVAAGTEAERPLEIELEESSSLELFLEPGYGSYERARMTIGMREKNLFGTGRIFRAEGTLSELAQSGKLGLTDPWLLGSDVVLDLTVFGNSRKQPSFRRIELGSGIEFTRRFSRHFRASLGYQYRRSDITDIEVLDAEAEDALDDVDISSILFSPTYDDRDNLFAPRDGSFTKVVFELASEAIGSQLGFFRVRATQSNFFELDDETSLAASIRSGVIAPIGDTETIPLQERFFNGGESTVRSFGEDELGPEDSDGTPLGGEAFSVLSIELRRKIWGSFEGALFYDIGNVVSDANEFLELKGLGEGIGVGLRYATPVGPIRLDGAINPDPDGGESRGAIHFSVGMAF